MAAGVESATKKILFYQIWQLWALFGLGLVLFITGSWWFYGLGMRHGASELIQVRAERNRLLDEVEDLGTVKRRLKEKVAVLERSSQIDQQASLEVRQNLGDLQDKLAQMREELAFYQGIMSPGEVKPGLRVHRLRWEPVGDEGRFLYNLTLVQVKRNDSAVQGVIHLSLEGDLDGASKVLSLDAITDPVVKKIPFKFRYFQHFKGKIQLPANFRPRSVLLKVVPKKARKSTPVLEVKLDWPT